MAKKYIEDLKLKIAKAKIFDTLLHNKSEKIFDVIELTSGENLPVSKMKQGKLNVYGGGGLTAQTHSESNVSFPTIGVGRVGARCGCVFRVEANSWVSDNALYISKLKKQYDLNFLIHFLNYCELNQFANIAAQPVISLKRISGVRIPSIPLDEQVKISSILDQIEQGKEYFEIDEFGVNNSLILVNTILGLQTELQTQQTLLAQLRQATLQEAVQGKLTERWRVEKRGFELSESDQVLGSSLGWTATQKTETGADLLARIRTEKADLIRQSKLRKEKPLPPITDAEKPFELPEGWVWCRLGGICDLITDGEHQTPPRQNLGRPLLSAKNIRDGYIDYSNIDYISEEHFQRAINRCRPQIGDILIVSVGATIGRSSILTTENTFAIVRSVALIKPSSLILNKFIKLVLDSPLLQNDITKRSWGTAQPCLYLNQIKEINIPLPPITEQQAIVAQVEHLLGQMSALELENKQQQAEVGQLMQAVLREAFAGKTVTEPVSYE